MPIQNDAKSTLFRILKHIPKNRFGIWILQHLPSPPNGKIPDHYHSRWVRIPRSASHGAVRALVVAPKSIPAPLPLVVHFHGGGHILGDPESSSLAQITNLGAAHDAVFVIPDYRLATDAPFPAGFDDCYDTLVWASENAAELGARPGDVIIGGESAGGGLTLYIALRARDEGRVKIAFQFPIYPMADDRDASWTDIPAKDISWSPWLNRFSWSALLGKKRRGGPGVTGYEAPARADDFRGMPPTMTYIGTLDLFLNETRDIVARLRSAGVDVAYREFEDVYHGQEMIAPQSAAAPIIQAHYRDTFAAFVRKYWA